MTIKILVPSDATIRAAREADRVMRRAHAGMPTVSHEVPERARVALQKQADAAIEVAEKLAHLDDEYRL